ncbi:MAG: carboxypeptidase-like regulatory domain-containing protein, partial [Phormidesmis sp. FL-bin-119]|nr:carboxypeptidase-like regulatory domain-containing protein [Pedobacter sp.]
MRKNILKIALTFVFLINACLLFAQGIKGKVTDSADGSTMPGVTISVNGTTKSTATSVTGEYNLKLDAGSYTIKASFLGYET